MFFKGSPSSPDVIARSSGTKKMPPVKLKAFLFWLPKQFPESYLLWQFAALITERNERNHTRIIAVPQETTA